MIRTALAATAAVVALSGAAVAEESIVIDTADVDFTDAAQAEAVYAKIVEASETICSALYLEGSDIRFNLGAAPRMYDACVAQTIEDTLATADVPALDAVHEMEDEDVEDYTIALND